MNAPFYEPQSGRRCKCIKCAEWIDKGQPRIGGEICGWDGWMVRKYAHPACIRPALEKELELIQQVLQELDDFTYQYTATTCPGRPCSADCDHIGVKP